MSLIILFFAHAHIADSRLTRKTPPTYGDGVYTINGGGRPSPRTLSQAFMKGYDGLGSLKNRTALATFFGKTKKHNTKKNANGKNNNDKNKQQ